MKSIKEIGHNLLCLTIGMLIYVGGLMVWNSIPGCQVSQTHTFQREDLIELRTGSGDLLGWMIHQKANGSQMKDVRLEYRNGALYQITEPK